MIDKVKLAVICVLIVFALGLAGVVGYKSFGPQPQLTRSKNVSMADLVRLEKNDPASLTDDQRKLLSTIPQAQKQQLLTAPSFTPPSAIHQKP